MKQLRNLSARPELVVSQAPSRVHDIVTQSDLGRPGPFGRERVVAALPTNKLRVLQLAAPQVMHDGSLCYLADPSGNLVGMAGVFVHRMVTAGKVADTRRL